jgi:hypothetical protein
MRATLSSFAHLGERLAKSQMTGLEQTATAAARTRADDPPRIRSEEGPPSFVVDAVASERRVSANFSGTRFGESHRPSRDAFAWA